jgi:putative nucleotidyltransferase with HDIG domain
MTKKEKEKVQQRRNLIFRDGVQGLRNRRATNFVGWLLLIVSVLLTIIIIPKGGLIPDFYSPGDIAARNIKSPRDLLVEDVPLTEAKKLEASNGVSLIYQYDATSGSQALERLVQGLEGVRAYQLSSGSRVDEDLLPRLEADLGLSLSSEEFMPLLEAPLTEELIAQSRELLRPVFEQPVVANLQIFQEDYKNGVEFIERSSGIVLDDRLGELAIGLNGALAQVDSQLEQLPELGIAQRQLLKQLVPQLLRPNLIFDQQATDSRRLSAQEQVAPVLFQIKKGEMIVRVGERLSAEQILKLQAIRDSGLDNRNLQSGAGLLICILLLLYIGYHFSSSNISKFCPDTRDLVFLSTVFLTYFILIKMSIFVASAVGNTFSYVDSETYLYAIPFALGAMLVRIVLNSETAFAFSVCSAVLVGVLFGNSLLMALYVLTASLVGAHGVRHCQQRTTLYRAGLWIGLTNMALLLGTHFLSGRVFELQLLWKLGFGFLGGLIAAIIVNGTVPLVESFFKYTTDIKLLELANMNSPILRQLMFEAPGTYHHSILVGNLAESAAEAINANPLLARVAAYYHDIGKIKKPLYFIENAGGQRNRHDKLAPSMSALILTSHVKDGVELAREHKLGSELMDIIQQHHGTTLIKFFYDRAKNMADPGVQQVDERDYRYHGPKPQTREAALIMLADAIEAASRTLTDPTTARIQGMVQKLINNIFIDGQLDECDLTLKDLNLIAKSFNRVLSSSFHHRVDYPEPVHVVKEKVDAPDKGATKEKVKSKNANSDRQPSEQTKDSETAAAKDSTEDLRRLGIS